MKRILILLLVMMLCLPCALAEEIGELPPPTVEQPDDPNEIGELGGNTTPNATTTVNESVEDAVPPAGGNELIEDATPAAPAAPVAPVAPAAPAASGETAKLKNMILAVPAGWSVVSNADDTAAGGAITLQMAANDGSNQMLQAQSQAIGTEEDIKKIFAAMSAESFLSQTLMGTMQNFGIIVENYDFVTLKGDVPCVRTTEIINMNSEVGECAVSIVVALDDTHMVVMMLVQQGVDAASGAEMMNVILSPMAQ